MPRPMVITGYCLMLTAAVVPVIGAMMACAGVLAIISTPLLGIVELLIGVPMLVATFPIAMLGMEMAWRPDRVTAHAQRQQS